MHKIAIIFPGGGAQTSGMMWDICQKYEIALNTFFEADKILKKDVSGLTFSGDEADLSKIENMQPCMLTAEVALWRVISQFGVVPTILSGFSLGEYTALVVAGILSFEQALILSQKRANYMSDATKHQEGGMAVIFGKTENEVYKLCEQIGGISPSNFTCPGQITVSGNLSGIEKLMEMKQQEEIAAHQVAVNVASHCELMRSASESLAVAMDEIEFNPPTIPIVMNVNAQIVTDPQQIKRNLIDQLVYPVKFQQSMELMLDQGIDTFLEVGPGDVLSRFVSKIAKAKRTDVDILNIEDIETLDAALTFFRVNR